MYTLRACLQTVRVRPARKDQPVLRETLGTILPNFTIEYSKHKRNFLSATLLCACVTNQPSVSRLHASEKKEGAAATTPNGSTDRHNNLSAVSYPKQSGFFKNARRGQTHLPSAFPFHAIPGKRWRQHTHARESRQTASPNSKRAFLSPSIPPALVTLPQFTLCGTS